jgi:hypothetical protein
VIKRLVCRLAFALVLALLHAACATDTVEMPEFTGPSVATVPSGSIVGHTVPQPSPTPTAVPTSSPTPTPSPQPTSSPSSSCSLPPGTGELRDCPRVADSFLAVVEAAIDEVVRSEPSLFDLQDAKCGNCYRVKDTARFVTRLLAALPRSVCATYDGEELAVKNTNEFSDQYDILTFDGYLRRGDGAYRATCRPAWF